MRRLAWTAPLLACVALAGCEWLKPRPKEAPAKDAFAPAQSDAQQHVAYLNAQSALVNSLHIQDLKIDVSEGGRSLPLGANTGTIVCEKPRSFALTAGRYAMPRVVQVGSNAEEFWVYSKVPSEAFYYCSHADFQSGKVQLPFPFDPDWVLQALGMSNYDDKLDYKLEGADGGRERRLSYDSRTPQGQPVRRTVVFAGGPVKERQPVVKQHIVTDPAGAVIATATITEVRRVALGKDQVVAVPAVMQLEWPQQRFKMTLRMPTVLVNDPITDQQRHALFDRPDTAGLQPTNLVNVRFEPMGVERGATPAPGTVGRRK